METNASMKARDRSGHIKDEVNNIRDEVGQSTAKVKDSVMEIAGETKAAAKESFEHGVQRLNEKSGEVISQIETAVVRQPIKSVVMAAGAGLLLGALLKRKR